VLNNPKFCPNFFFIFSRLTLSFVQVVEHVKSRGATKVILFRFCAGAKIVLDAVKEAPVSADLIGLHPPFFTTEDNPHLTCPALVIAAKDDPDLKPFVKNVNQTYQSEHYR